jgi:hypothetical protein
MMMRRRIGFGTGRTLGRVSLGRLREFNDRQAIGNSNSAAGFPEFPNAELLVSADSVQSLGSKGLVVIDARTSRL